MQSFARFQELAPELRAKVYSFFHVPRLITIGYGNLACHPTASFASAGILAVSKESRGEAQRAYVSLFKKSSELPCHPLVNPAIDICFIAYTQCGLGICGCLLILDCIDEGVKKSLKHLAINYLLWRERDKATFNQLLSLKNLEHITIVITALPYPITESGRELSSREESVLLNYADIDDRIEVPSRRNRREHIEWMKAEAREEFSSLASEHPAWKIPEIDIKLLMRGGRILRDLDDYFEDNGDTYPDYLLEDDYTASRDVSMIEGSGSFSGSEGEEPKVSWRTWNGVLKEVIQSEE